MILLTVGSTITDDKGNHFILDEIIGQGGFGYVFKAHKTSDHSVWAIKTTLPSFGDSSSIQAFKNEICTAISVSNENVIRYEYVHNGDDFPEFPPYIIMEYADGGTLGSLLNKRKHLNETYQSNELINIFRQLAEGMQQVNRLLVHRDIKPDNILICNDTLKISDFGLSKVAAESTRTMSFKGSGTPLYMAPEAWDLTKNTVQMDIYSMGIIFYQLATLQYPYSPIPVTYDECKEMHLLKAITNISDIAPSLHPSIVSLINRMLEKSIKRRFANWDDIIASLDSQTSRTSSVDEIAATVLNIKNAEDIARQREEAMFLQAQKEKEDFLKLVHSQFEQVIVKPIIDLIEKVNLQYSGVDKLTYSKNIPNSYEQTNFFGELNTSPTNSIRINFEALLKENFFREVYGDTYFNRHHARKENYIPQFRNKNILAWGEIVNRSRLGFNILLLDSGDIYGDWIIMNNKNNSIAPGAERAEPFAFSLRELPTEIHKVQMMHRYRSEFHDFDVELFLKSIQQLFKVRA